MLYSCDFSDKSQVEGERKEPPSPAVENNLVTQGQGVKLGKAKARLESAWKSLQDEDKARRALEAALSLARHPAKEDSAGESTKRTTYNSSVVSIPLALSRSKKLLAGVPHGHIKEASTATARSTGGRNSSLELSEKQTDSQTESSWPKTGSAQSDPFTDAPAPTLPCLCRRSTSSLVGTNRKGWEGTATLYHGSRLRFGCLQFVFSIAGRPGHPELVEALSHLLQSDHDL